MIRKICFTSLSVTTGVLFSMWLQLRDLCIMNLLFVSRWLVVNYSHSVTWEKTIIFSAMFMALPCSRLECVVSLTLVRQCILMGFPPPPLCFFYFATYFEACWHLSFHVDRPSMHIPLGFFLSMFHHLGCEECGDHAWHCDSPHVCLSSHLKMHGNTTIYIQLLNCVCLFPAYVYDFSSSRGTCVQFRSSFYLSCWIREIVFIPHQWDLNFGGT